MTELPGSGRALQVIATAGHVDHGKSALILRLTGIDPDRLAEEKRRGLTIDLGFAWISLPSGQEIGFVDVPGHERFVRNMLAGVGPVRLVLFVVAADEGWKRQSEEHLAIVDVLGVEGGVVALTKRDLVDAERLAERTREVRRHLAGTRLSEAPIVACSALTGEGLDDLLGALDAMIAGAPDPERTGRPRQFIDRVFTIRGAGTVVTGTLTGGSLAVGQEAEILPGGHRARIRSLQTHRRSLPTAVPVSRVAVNLAGTARGELERGDVLVTPGQWRPTTILEGWIRPVRGLAHPISARGAYKLHLGSAERDARIRLYGATELREGQRAFVRVTLTRPVVADLFDPFVLRDAGRQATVAGGVVLDPDPPGRPGPHPEDRLGAREGRTRPEVGRRLVAERGLFPASRVAVVTGATPEDVAGLGAIAVDGWLADPDLLDAVGGALVEAVAARHAERPHAPGLEPPEARALLARTHRAMAETAAADAAIAHLVATGRLVRTGTSLRLPQHRSAGEDDEITRRLVEEVRRGEPSPPTIKELVAAGFGLDVIRAACSAGRLVRVSPDLVVTPELVSRAERLVRELARPPGLTVSAFKESLGTSRKFALPLLEYFDGRGVTRRQGDVRVVRG